MHDANDGENVNKYPPMYTQVYSATKLALPVLRNAIRFKLRPLKNCSGKVNYNTSVSYLLKISSNIIMVFLEKCFTFKFSIM